MAKKRQKNIGTEKSRQPFLGNVEDKHQEARSSLGRTFCLLTFFNDRYVFIFGGNRNPAVKTYRKIAVVSIAENNSDQDEILEILDDYFRTFKRDFHPDGRDFTFGVVLDCLTKELKEVFEHPMSVQGIMAESFILDPFLNAIAVINYSGEYEIASLEDVSQKDRPLFIIGAYNPVFKRALLRGINGILIKMGSNVSDEEFENEFRKLAIKLKVEAFGISTISGT